MNNLEKYKEDYKRLKEYGNALQYGFIFDYCITHVERNNSDDLKKYKKMLDELKDNL